MKFLNMDINTNIFLAPMAGITDLAFRSLCKNYGAGLVYSEMISAKALSYQDRKTYKLLTTNEAEAPLAVQLFGSDPFIMGESAKKMEDMGFSVIDINMGCPAPKIVNNGEGAALMRDVSLSAKIVESMKKSVTIPISVKCRKGFDEKNVNVLSFVQTLENAGLDAVTIHGRTRDQFYSGKADWDIIKKVKQAVKIPVVGNGDAATSLDAEKMMEETGCDAVMIGRGAMGNPWVFSGEMPCMEERLRVAFLHADMLIDLKGEYIGVREARKHLSWYIKGMKGASKAKEKINVAQSKRELKDILYSILLNK